MFFHLHIVIGSYRFLWNEVGTSEECTLADDCNHHNFTKYIYCRTYTGINGYLCGVQVQ